MKLAIAATACALLASGCGEYELEDSAGPELPPGPLHSIDADPAWSPDGRRIAFTRGAPNLLSETFNLRWVEVESGREGAITRGSGHVDRDPDWSPRGDRIAFTRSRDQLFCNEDDVVYTVRVADGRLRRVGRGCAPEWAPRGGRIAFLAGSTLVIAGPRGSRARRLAAGVFSYDWSPDGSRLVVERANELWIVAADGHALRRLTRSGPARVAHGPAWSPDGSLILHDRYTGGDAGLWVMRPDGGGARKIASDEIYDRSWSPDDRRVFFGGGGGLFVLDRDGGNEQRLPDTFGESFGGFSRDGRFVAFGGSTAGTLSPDPYPIVVVDVETAKVSRATQRPRRPAQSSR